LWDEKNKNKNKNNNTKLKKKKVKKKVMLNKKNILVVCWENHVDEMYYEGWKQIITTEEEQELAWH
jgi:hypothetical protein